MIFLLIPFLIAELFFSLKVVEVIGAGWSVVWILGSIFFGVLLLKNSHYAIFSSIDSVARGQLDLQSFQNASMAYMFGALLLIVPGILTDILGLLALLYTIYLRFVAKMTPEKTNINPKGDDDVIDVEIIDERSRSDDNA